MQTLYALSLSYKMEKLSSLIIRTLTHQSPKLKVCVLRFLEKIIHTKAAYSNKKEEILNFLEEIKKSLFGLMSNPNKQVRDAFFNFKKFLVEQELMDEVPSSDQPKPKRNMSRAMSSRQILSKRNLGSMRTIQPSKKKGVSQSRRHLMKSQTLLNPEAKFQRVDSVKKST